MDDVSIAIYKDISIMPVFNLENVCEERIGSKRINEIPLLLRHLIAEHFLIEFVKTHKIRCVFLQSIDRY